ncbi:proliferation marker protein Ki-67 isoform X2 [Camelus dromedarius]|uniref:proliferation marker protein Ki-67 isoform X2 n=1 Tax=Camelus dromedarius TaxID=9838 RepID=UPI003119635D
MGPARRLVTIKRSGLDGPSFPLSLSSCLFGRGIECDIRIQLPVVSKQHCKIEINRQEAILSNFSSTNPTQVNGSAIDKPVQLKHGDVITIVDRSFRYENESHQHGSQSTEFPGQRREQEPSRRVSRSSFSSNPGGKVQDSSDRSKLTEENVSGKPLVHEENTVAAGTAVSDGSEEGVARETPDGVHSSGLPRDNCRSATDPTAGAFQEDSSVTLGSCNGGGKAFPTIQGLKNSDKNESPFRRLYESMKLELDVKSEKVNVLQNRRKSGSRSHCTTEKESAGGLEGESPISLVSLKSRLKSSRSPQIKGEQGSSQTGEQRSVEETVQAPKDTRSPGILRTEMVVTKTTTPLRYSQQNSSRRCQSEDLGAVSRRESVSLDQSEGFGAEHKMFTPQKFLPRNQTPIKVENAGSFGNTPEKFSKKRKSIPTSVDNLPTETEMVQQTVPAPLVLQAEGKIQNGFLNKTAGQMCPGAPGPDAADAGSFGDSINKVEGVSLKRRRVSFGGRLRPELFDENLPPNTPLKRGETPKQRRSLVAHTPAVLKKIIKPHPSGKGNSSETRPEVTTPDTCAKAPAPATTSTPPAAADRCRRSPKASSVSSGSRSHQADTPKRGGRKSGNLPSKRASLDRSQHGILQMIYSKRRSGASEANLIVAKSWADVVKLGAKQTQTKAVKRGPQRLLSKRQRRANTPKKPTGITDHQFSTGHANSPCTIIIGKAHIERVNGPARPYTMLNSFVFNKPADFSEDLSGLTEMFQTPVKEKPQRMSLGPSTLSNSGDFIGKKLPVSNSGEEPLLHTAEYSGENVFPSAQEVPAEPSGKRSASPGRLKINERTVKTPGSVYQAPGAKRETQESEAAPPKAAPSANRCRRCAEPRARQRPGAESASEDAEPDTVEDISGRRLRNAPPPGQKPEGRGKESERFFERCKKNIESKEDSGKMMAVRRSRRASELKWEPTADLTTLMRLQETEFKEDSVDIPSVPQTPARAEEPTDAENRTTKLHWKSPQPDRISSPARTNTQPKTPSRKGDVEEVSALGKPTQTPGDATHTDRGPGDDENINLCKETPKQKQNPAENVTGSKRRPRTPKEKARSLEDLIGFKELFQTPHLVKEPMIDDKTPQIPCKSPRPEPVVTSTSMTRPFKTLSLKAEVQEDLSALRKPTQTPGDTTHSHGGPAGADKDIQMFNETSRQKLDFAESVTGIKRRPRTPKEKVQSLEDLAGFKELFQTPVCTKEPTAVVKTPQMLWISPQPKPNVTPTNRKRQLKTPPQKVDREVELSAPRKSTQTPGETRHSDSELVGDDEHRAFKENPKQKLDSAENVTGSKKRSRTPKTKAPPLEDLIGFKELFQTPHHVKQPMTDDKTPQIPCKSPRLEPVDTPASRKGQLKTAPQKVDREGELSALRKPTQTPGDTTHSHGGPAGADKDIQMFNETSRQKLDPVENVTGIKRRPRTPKEKVQSLEDLAGFKELFQTPVRTKEPTAVVKTPQMLWISPQPEPNVTPTNRKRQLKTPPQKVDREVELSAPRKSTQTPGDTRHSDSELVGDDEHRAFKESPKQKLESAENVAGSKRQSRTPKTKAPPLEDLIGFKELFQTPHHVKEPVTDDKNPKVLCQSPQPEPLVTSTSMTRLLKTPPRNVEMQEDVSALRKPTQTAGNTRPSHRGPVGDDKSIRLLKETPEQKLESAENLTGSKRRPRTPKEKVPPLEDLIGFKELFQTPHHTVEPMTDNKPSKIPCKSPPLESVNTPSRKRQLKTAPQKVDREGELSALRKPTQTPGDTTHSHGGPAGADKDIQMFNETSRQKLDFAESVTGIKRRPRTPKEKVQSLEDLAGFKELFQTPVCTKEPTAVVKTPQMLWISPQPEPNVTPTNRKRQLKTPLQKVDREVELSAPRKSTQTPGDTRHSDSELVGDDEHRAFKESPKQKLESAENVAGSKKRSRTPKTKAPPLEDLIGFKELFQTPHHVKQPMTDDKTPQIPCKSPRPEPVDTPASRKGRLKTAPRKAEVQEGLSALTRPTQTSGDTTLSHRGPEGGDRGIAVSQETPKPKLDSAANVAVSKRRPRTPKEKAPPLEDLTGFKELFQTPDHAKEPVAENKITRIPCKSPPAEPVTRRTSRKRRLRSPPGKVGVGEVSALGEPTLTPGDATHREAVGDDKDVKVFRKTSRQKLDSAEKIIGVGSRLRSCKQKTQPLEDPSLKELVQKPRQAKGTTRAAKATTVPCQSAPAEPAPGPTGRKRRLKSPPEKADVAEVSALREPIQAPGETTRTHGEPVSEEKDTQVFRKPSRQKLDPSENITGMKSRLRTFKEKTQPLEAPDSLEELVRKPDQTREQTSDAKIPVMPCQSPPAQPVTRPTSRKRRLRSPPGKAGVGEVSALGKPTLTPGDATHREAVGDDKDVKVFRKTSRQKLDSAEKIIGVGSWLRSCKEKTQPLEDPSLKELVRKPRQAKELGSGAAGIKRAPKEAPVGRNPAKIPQRVLRAPKLRFMEDLDLVGKEDPMKSPSASSVSPPPPKRRRGEDGSVTGRKTLRPATATQGIAGERSPQKPRTAPRDGWPQPEPLVRRKKSLRTLAPRTERVENLPDGDTGAKATGRQAEDAHPPAKGMSLRSRGRSKTDVGEQQPESLTSAEKVKMKRKEKKPLKTSQEKQLQRPEDGADNPASGGQVHERRMCLRSRRQQKTPPPAAAEESAGEEGAGAHGGSREGEGAAERAGLLGSRSRRTAAHPPATPAESESERRVTRGARRHARGPPKAGK